MTAPPPVRRVRWAKTYRAVPSRFPPIQLFERIGDPADWEALAEIEGLTNDRLRDEIGEIALVPPDQRVSGPGASWVMASFTHVGRPSRFSDGSYGVHYVARRKETAVAETIHHMGRFYAATREPALDVDMRLLIGRVDAALHDLRDAAPSWRPALDPDDYGAGQALGRALRDAGSLGVVYGSVRDAGGECIGAFLPRAVVPPIQGPHLRYHWDGARIDRWFDYGDETWTAVPPPTGA
ncbi:MAG: RES family NAD+ phosphorylase [Planctomycetota bacterium JB042]